MITVHGPGRHSHCRGDGAAGVGTKGSLYHSPGMPPWPSFVHEPQSFHNVMVLAEKSDIFEWSKSTLWGQETPCSTDKVLGVAGWGTKFYASELNSHIKKKSGCGDMPPCNGGRDSDSLGLARQPVSLKQWVSGSMSDSVSKNRMNGSSGITLEVVWTCTYIHR